MSNVSAHTLFTAFRESGRLTDDQLAAAERAFTEVGHDAGQLADRLSELGCLTKYQFRKIQLGRAVDLLFGHYLILERIGEGGMGKVYRAIELRLGRMVALKTIRPNLLANKTVISRYKREARAAGALEHPNIVKLYEAEDVDGRYYLAMEMVEGMDLSRLTKELLKDKRTILPAEAAEYIRQAALGLQHAHDKGLVHRDIKPSNLLVSGERAIPGTGGKATVKILDMGLVRSLIEDEATQMDLTRDGTVVGTPDYMSPEQAKNSSTVGPAADLYSLGCTLFYIIRGAPPFSDGTAIDKLIRHQLDPIPDIRQYRPDVPAGLAAVIKRTMAKRPEERFASATDLARELSMYTEDGIAFEVPATAAGSNAFQFVDLAPSGTPEPKATPATAASTAGSTTSSTTAPPQVTRTVRPLVAQGGGASASGAVPGGRTVKPLSTASVTRPKVPVKPKPISKPPADASPSDSLPGSPDPKRPARGDTPVGGTRTRKAGKRVVKKSEGFPVVPVAVAAAVVIALIVVAAVILSRSNSPTSPSGRVTAPVEAAKANTPAANPPAAMAAFRPVPELMPDQTAAVLVAAPKAFWDRAQADVPAAAHARKTAEFLGKFFRFDPWRFDRVVVSFHADAHRCVAAAEGEPLAKPDQFRKELDQLRRLNAEGGPNGATLYKQVRANGNPFNKDRDVRAVLLASPAVYLIGTDLDDLTEMFKSGTRKGPEKVSPKLLAAASEAGSPRADGGPLLTFAASGDFQWPGRGQTPFKKAGVELLTLSVQLADKRFQLELALCGASADDLRRFAGTLPGVIEAHASGADGKQLAEAVRAAVKDSSPAESGGTHTLTLRFAWDWQAVLNAAELLIPPPPSLFDK